MAKSKSSRYEKLKKSLIMLAVGVQKLTESESWLKFLKFRKSFHNYSFGNCMLIYLQKQNATMVAGIKKWNEMGRKVKKGEKGIRILVPFYKKEPLDKVIAELEDSGETIYVKKLSGFAVRYVYDISQTEGEPIPGEKFQEMDEEPEYENRKYTPEELYDILVRACSVPVEEVPPRSNGWHGAWYPESRKIQISKEDSTLLKISTLLHEIAHIHTPPEILKIKDLAEYIAESVSAIICKEFLSIDSTKNAVKYLAAYGGNERKIIKASSIILEVAEIVTGFLQDKAITEVTA